MSEVVMGATVESTDFYMPAEWETHEGTWLAWPHQSTDWPGKMAPIPWVYAEIVRLLHQHETVNILINNAVWEARVRKILENYSLNSKNLRFWQHPTNRVWTRDYGPIFVVNPSGEKKLLSWRFNAWAKYDNWKKDNAIPKLIAQDLGLPLWEPECKQKPVVLEGGSIEVNGKGLLLTTEECLLSEIQCRNPGLSREDLEGVFQKYLGIQKVLWLNQGIVGDDTHGHIDDLARFINPTTIVVAQEDNPADENYPILKENLERLQGMTDQHQHKLEIIPLPMPEPIFFNGQRLPASYANFYIANELVLVPTFNDSSDRIALGILADCFPDRKVIGVHCVDLVWGLGTLHCMTQQDPSAKII